MPRKILIVDDNSINRALLARALSDDYDIIEAADGLEAKRLISRHYQTLSAVLLDIIMPDIDGYEVLRGLRSNPALAQIPVIMVTGSQDEDARVRSLELGANDFITKPFNPDIVRHCLRNCINLRESASIVNAIQRDKLTGVYTREAFFDKVALYIKDKQPGYYVLSCFDIDNFKVVNDQYGSAEGDRILATLGQLVRRDMEKSGGICGRISADNFAALFPAERMREGSNFFERIRSAQESEELFSLPLSFSEGRYIVTDLSLSGAAIYDRAYLAKRSVKGRYDKHIAYFDERMRDELLLEQQLIAEMAQALERREFEAWFQPQYNHSSGALIGAEALVRWRHPRKGLISPAEFIPVFEQNGFIYELDRFIWEEVCRYLRKWTDEGRDPLPVAVNISRYDIFRPDLVESITGLIKKYDLTPELLRLEITESAFSQSTEQIITVVKRLLKLGFTVEIDDFGSGYSSLNTLKDVPAGVLKLDMKFLEGSENSQRSGNIIESVIRMAKWLNMAVIAEGVETREQADFLKSIGSSYVQGYLYARPMPAEDYERLFKSMVREERLLRLETVENLDNNAFWDPRSMDTLIFNSYVGGACIFEYDTGREELLRANDKYSMTFGEAVTGEDIYRYPVPHYLDDANRELRKNSIERAIATGEETSFEMNSSGVYGVGGTLYIRWTLRVIARSGTSYLLYCTVENTTARHEAERGMQEAVERFSVIMADINCGITAATLLEGQEALLFANDRYYELHGVTRESYKTKAEGVYSLILPEDRERIRQGAREAYRSKKPARLEYRTLLPGGEERWIRVELSSTRFTGVAENVQLCIFTDISAAKRDERELKDAYSLLTTLMNDTPGGFTRFKLLPDGGVEPVYFNEGFLKLLGADEERFRSRCRDGILSSMHPEDVPVISDAIERMLRNGEAQSTRYRLRRGDGSYIWLLSFGRVTKSERGETFLNIYYNDATGRVRLEGLQRELLDNLPCGAALYGYDGRELTIIHINKRYWELVDRKPQENANVKAAIHPDDRQKVAISLDRAIAEGRDAVCDLRLLCGDGSYLAFHIVGRVIPREDGGYAVYASYTALSDRAAALANLLPAVLSMIMESTSDLSFVKDTELRYLCASRQFAKLVGCESDIELIGKTDYDLFDKELADRYRADDLELIRSEKPLIDKLEFIPSDDIVSHYSSTSKYLLRDEAGGVIGLYGVGRDITEYRGAFEQLSFLIDNVQGGLATCLFSEDCVKFIYFNDTLCRILGYDRPELSSIVGDNALEIVSGEDRDAVRGEIRKLLDTGGSINATFRVYAREGEPRWISLRGNPFERREGAVLVNAIMFDVTENRREIGTMTRAMLEQRLKYQELLQKTYDLTLEVMPDYVAKWLFKDGDVLLSYANQKYLDFLGVRAETAFGCSIRYGFANPEDQGLIHFLYSKEKNRESLQFTTQSLNAQRELRYLTVNASFFEEQDGCSVYYGTLTDVTELVETQQRLRLSEKEYKIAASLSDCSILRYDVGRDSVTLLSQGKNDMRFPQYGENAAQQVIEDGHIAPESLETYYIILENIKNGIQGGRDTLVFRRSSGEKRWAEIGYSIIADDCDRPVTAIITIDDQTDVKQAELDGMTGLYNKFTAETRIKAALEAGDCLPYALLVADLDNLKTINDTLGHDQGDRAISSFGETLRAQFRQTDIVGRIGGDEFVVFLSSCGSEKWLDGVMRSLHKKLLKLRVGADAQFSVHGSIGVVTSEGGGSPFYEELFRQADKALYHVKRNGKNDYAFYVPEMEKTFYTYKSRAAEGRDGILSMTMREAGSLMEELNLVFDIVRMVDAEHMIPYSLNGDNRLNPGEHQCYAVWNRENRCENCTSYRALVEKSRFTKLERLGNDVYQIVSKYVEVDDKPYVLETVIKTTVE